MRRLLILFSSGALGAVLERGAGWMAAKSGLFAMIGSGYYPRFFSPALYQHVVWGGLWAFVLILPGLSTMSWLQGGLLLSLFPSAAELLYFLPRAGEGYFGMREGFMTPAVVILLNLIWGCITAFSAARNR